MRNCPYCAESIQDEAIICRYCGHDVRVPPPPAQPQLQPPPPESRAAPVRYMRELERPAHWIWYLLIGLVTLIAMGAASLFAGYLGYPADPLTAGYDYWTTVDTISGCGALISLVFTWLLAARGKYGTLTIRNLLVTALWMIVPILNWAIVYYLGKGIYMVITHQEYVEKPAA